MIKNKFLRILSFFAFPAILFFFSLCIGEVFDVYLIFPWVDIPMHFLGGFLIAYMATLFIKFFREENLLRINNRLVFVLIVVSLVGTIAVLWEFWEFFMDYFFYLNWQPSLEDTLLDLFMGLFGGFSFAIFQKKY